MKVIIALVFSLLIAQCAAMDRTVEKVLNPNCTVDDDCNAYNLLYVKATGESDILHILYSTIRTFTIMFFRTDLDTNINVNWTNVVSEEPELVKDSIQFSKKINESCAYLIPSIYEFNDLDGTADMTKIPNNESYWNVRHTANLKWTFKNDSKSNIGVFEGKEDNSNGTFNFFVRYYGKAIRDTLLPHALFSDETSAIDFALDSVNATFKLSKFAINVQFQSDVNDITLLNQKTLDDEYTPGTFQQWTIKVFDEKDDAKKYHNYLQWKPIFYFDKERTLENAAITKYYPIGKNENASAGINWAFYDDSNVASSINISLGLAGDEKDGYFYTQTNYSVFTFTLGLGEPQPEKMSFVVTLTIFIGFGLPAFVIVSGLFVMAVRKCKNSTRAGYETL